MDFGHAIGTRAHVMGNGVRLAWCNSQVRLVVTWRDRRPASKIFRAGRSNGWRICARCQRVYERTRNRNVAH